MQNVVEVHEIPISWPPAGLGTANLRPGRAVPVLEDCGDHRIGRLFGVGTHRDAVGVTRARDPVELRVGERRVEPVATRGTS